MGSSSIKVRCQNFPTNQISVCDYSVLLYLKRWSRLLRQRAKVVNFKPQYFPPANEVCEGNVFTGVFLFTGGGGGVSVQGGLCPVGAQSGRPPYGKERAVRILLECILVFFYIYFIVARDLKLHAS